MSRDAGREPERAGIVGRLVASMLADPRTCHLGPTVLPSRESAGDLVELVRGIVFPGFFGKRPLTSDMLESHVEDVVSRVRAHVLAEARSALRYMEGLRSGSTRGVAEVSPVAERTCQERALEVADRFVDRLAELRRMLSLDVQAAYDGDPAAVHTDETIFCYPGVDAIFAHRVAHEFYSMGVPLLPRIISEMAHSRTGIDIHPGATIGECFFIDHGGGVVIGETTVIGRRVRLYQGVTLGARSVERDAHGRLVRGTKRHPTIGDRVTIYAGAVILGGDTVIGHDCVVGGGVFITESIPPGHVVRPTPPQLVLRAPDEAPRSRRRGAR